MPFIPAHPENRMPDATATLVTSPDALAELVEPSDAIVSNGIHAVVKPEPRPAAAHRSGPQSAAAGMESVDSHTRPMRIAVLSFLFNWPSTGGGIVHTVELVRFLKHAGYDVRLIHPTFDPWQLGQVQPDCPVRTTSLRFGERDWNVRTIQRRFRAAVDKFAPDHVIITDCWNFKPHLAQAMEGYSYFLRMQALECVCPLNNLRLLPSRGGPVQCGGNQLTDASRCHHCLRLHAHQSGALHQAERALSGVGTPDYVALLQRSVQNATAVLVLSTSAQQLYQATARRAEIVTWGMDGARFPKRWDPEPRIEGCDGLKTLLFAGLVDEPIKGFDVLRLACRRLWERRQDFRLVVTAQAPNEPEPFAHYVGWQSQQDLPRYFRATDFTVVPSVAQDGLSRTAGEAMGAGRPVIASRLGGTPDLVTDEQTGLLVVPGSPDELAAAIERLLDDGDLCAAMGAAGRERFEQRIEWTGVIARQYAPLLQRCRPRAAAHAPIRFVSQRQLLNDIRNWSAQLPEDLVAVAGVPRSGILPATLLALHRNIHLVTIEQLERDESPWRHALRRGVPARDEGCVLVLDDSVHSGGTLRAVRERLQHRPDVRYGAVYASDLTSDVAEFACRQIPQPRCFEWNVFHSDHIAAACVDLDGVLCEDWFGHEADSGPDLERYRQHVHHARPRFIPTYPVRAIVTSRLAKYRAATAEWLERHGIRYGELVMSPHGTAAARQSAADHAAFKAREYAARPEAVLFIESNAAQAAEIAQRTGRPVLCTDLMELTGHGRCA